jgi:diaminopimelate epimerase
MARLPTRTRPPASREFWKMSGSGNDFVFFDAREIPAGRLADPEIIQGLCARRTGIGADGVVLLQDFDWGDFRMRYFNADGSPASLCGNAALCSARLAVDLGASDPENIRFASDAGVITGRIRDGLPEVDLAPVEEVATDVDLELAAGETRIGYALAGVPHAVVLCANADAVALDTRGRALRRHTAFRDGANVDFVSPAASGWRMRTYERGVEAETLACGTGAVATAALLAAWGRTEEGDTKIVTSSGLPLTVRLVRDRGRWRPSLRGSAVVTFRGSVDIPR